ncbi:MAG: hypothetical protein C0425_05390 [Chlorobiaceae bacterium]|nr:hypothetical protein [Chlorobiaceae bacterium]MBA4309751.1 hypothetical protein [Chlorobiaceae bacterium]
MKKIIFLAIFVSLLFSSCSVFQTFVNISRLQFKIDGANNISVAGVSVQNKISISDFNAMDILKFTTSITRGTLPITFILNVEARNPNDGTGGFARTDATLKAFPYRLVVDNVEVFSGDITSAVVIPAAGQSSIIPIQISFDLVESFRNRGLDGLINLAINIAGLGGGNSTNISLYAKPVVGTPIGNISYPKEIKVVDMSFSE